MNEKDALALAIRDQMAKEYPLNQDNDKWHIEFARRLREALRHEFNAAPSEAWQGEPQWVHELRKLVPQPPREITYEQGWAILDFVQDKLWKAAPANAAQAAQSEAAPTDSEGWDKSWNDPIGRLTVPAPEAAPKDRYEIPAFLWKHHD